MAEKNIKSLPTEVLTSIVNCLECERDALLQLARVSHTVNKIAMPLLYHSYQTPSTQDEASFHHFYSYLGTILSNAQLALHVKHVSLDLSDTNVTEHTDIGDELRDLSGSRINLICSGRLKVHLEKDICQKWLQWSRYPLQNSLYTLLLYCLPNLETMFLGEGYKPRSFRNSLMLP